MSLPEDRILPDPAKDVRRVCRQCGLAANVLTCLAKYGELPKKYAFEVSTLRPGICDMCGRQTQITEARDFFYPDFKLINKARWAKALRASQERKNIRRCQSF